MVTDFGQLAIHSVLCNLNCIEVLTREWLECYYSNAKIENHINGYYYLSPKKKEKTNNLPIFPKYVCTWTYCTVATKSEAKITSNCKSQLFFPAPNPLWIWYAGKLPSKQTTNFPKQVKKNYDTHQTKYKEKHKNRM